MLELWFVPACVALLCLSVVSWVCVGGPSFLFCLSVKRVCVSQEGPTAASIASLVSSLSHRSRPCLVVLCYGCARVFFPHAPARIAFAAPLRPSTVPHCFLSFYELFGHKHLAAPEIGFLPPLASCPRVLFPTNG